MRESASLPGCVPPEQSVLLTLVANYVDFALGASFDMASEALWRWERRRILLTLSKGSERLKL